MLRHPWILLAVLVLGGGIIAGCVDEAPPGPLRLDAPDWHVGATWTYAYEASERIAYTDQSFNDTNRLSNGTVRMTVIDEGVTPDDRLAHGLMVESLGPIRLLGDEAVREGVHLLDSATHQPIAGPRSPTWDPFCSYDLTNAVPSFWPLRFPLEPDQQRHDAYRFGDFHVFVRGSGVVGTEAGAFDAIRIDMAPGPIMADPGDHYERVTVWYSADVQNIVLMEREQIIEHPVFGRVLYANARMELVDHALGVRSDAGRGVAALRDPSSPIAWTPAPPVHLRIVSDQPGNVPLDGATRIRFALDPTDQPGQARKAPQHPDFYSVARADLGDVEVQWHAREGDRPWRTIGSGNSAAITTTNVTWLDVRADLRLGDGRQCLNGSSEREQREHLRMRTVYEWQGRIEVPPGVTAPVPLVELPPKNGAAELSLSWSTASATDPLMRAPGRPVAACEACVAEPGPTGSTSWFIWEETPLGVAWLPAGVGPTDEAPLHAGHFVDVELLMAKPWPIH